MWPPHYRWWIRPRHGCPNICVQLEIGRKRHYVRVQTIPLCRHELELVRRVLAHGPISVRLRHACVARIGEFYRGEITMSSHCTCAELNSSFSSTTSLPHHGRLRPVVSVCGPHVLLYIQGSEHSRKTQQTSPHTPDLSPQSFVRAHDGQGSQTLGRRPSHDITI